MKRLGMPTSDDTILRHLKRRAKANRTGTSIRVVGFDDWAWRKGSTYGTIMVDLERREVIDLLPDRSAGTTADWFKQHPDIEIISRDRCGLFAQGPHEGAPHARQIADRFHILQNLRETIQAQLSRAAGSSARPLLPADIDDEREAVISRSPRDRHGGAEHRCLSRMANQHSRQAFFERVRALRREGRSVSDIVRQTGLDRRTIAKWIRADALPQRNAAAPKTTSPRCFEEYLSRRWSEGCVRGRRLFQEIKARGYPWGHRTNIQWLCPKSKTARLLQQPALIGRTAGGRRSFQRRLLRRLNFWTSPVAAHSRRKTSCASLRRSTARRASPERSARSCAARGRKEDARADGSGSPRRRSRQSNGPDFDVGKALHSLLGKDLTRIHGMGPYLALKLVSECGDDLSAWPSAKHFTSWLCLAPSNKISGGKVLSSRTRRSGSRAASLLRLAAVTIGRTDTALGAFYRRLFARAGKSKAVTATARKIATLFYNALRHGMDYVDPGASYYETRYILRDPLSGAGCQKSSSACQGLRLRPTGSRHLGGTNIS